MQKAIFGGPVAIALLLILETYYKGRDNETTNTFLRLLCLLCVIAKQQNRSGQLIHGEKVGLRTINKYAHPIVHNVGDLQDFRYCHPGLLLGQRI